MQNPRAKLPEKAKVGDVIQVKTLISDVMETGQRKDADGKTIPRKIINSFSAKFAGQEVFSADLYPGIAANPYLSCLLKVPRPRALEFYWVGVSGARAVEKQTLNVVA
jgi:sulfur-oxidizing protein SoxZ